MPRKPREKKQTPGDQTSATLELADGRALGYAEYGDPKGEPLFHFHGHPGSRLEAQLAHADAEREGVRIIAIDRPGYGLSDYKPGRRLLDWPDDVVEASVSMASGAACGGSSRWSLPEDDRIDSRQVGASRSS
jgi:pimeloyl-ACP methyl ester carboxylesterase